MDPITLTVVIAVGCSSAAAAWMGVRRRSRASRSSPGPRGVAGAARGASLASSGLGDATSWARVGDVWTYLNEEYWLSAELLLVREGSPVLRLFLAPERGRDRWVAVAREGRGLWVLDVSDKLHRIGWPGVEVPTDAGVLRRVETGNVAIAPSGEIPPGWEGLGRYAVFRTMDNVAVFVEGPQKERLALVGRVVPRALVEKVG